MKAANTSKMVLTGELETASVDAIHNFAKAEATQRKGIANMSGHLLKLAQLAQVKGKERAEELFGLMTRHAEKVYKEEKSPDLKTLTPIAKLLPGWPVAKSQILKGMKAKLDLSKLKTVYEVIEATPTAKRKPAGQTTAGEGNGEGEGAISAPKGVEGDALIKALKRLNNTVRAITVQKPELIGATAKAIDALCESLDEMANLEEQADAKTGKNNEGAGIPSEAQA